MYELYIYIYINKSGSNEKLVETITRSIKHFQLTKGITKKRQGNVIKMSVQKTKKKDKRRIM